MKRNLKKWLLRMSFVAAPAVFAFGLLFSSVAPVASEIAEDVTNSVIAAPEKTTFFNVTKTDDSISIMLDADIHAYKTISRSTVKSFGSQIIKGIRDLIKTQVNDIFDGTPVLNIAGENPEAIQMGHIVAEVIKANLVDEIGQPSREYCESFLSGNEVIKNACKYLFHWEIKLVLSQMADNLTSSEIEALVDGYKTFVCNKINDVLAAAYEGEQTIPTCNTLVGEWIESAYKSTSINLDLNGLVKLLNVLEASFLSKAVTVKNLIATISHPDNLANLLKVIQNATADQLVLLFTKTNSELLGKFLSTIGFTSDDMVVVLGKWGNKIFDVVNQISRENFQLIIDGLKAGGNYNADVVKQGFVDSVTFKGVIKNITDIVIDGHLVLRDKALVKEGVIDVLTSLPKPNVIAQYTDEQMNHSWNVEVSTNTGTAKFKVTVGFYGDCSKIRKACEIIARYFTVHYNKETDSLYIDFKGPEAISTIMQELLNGDKINDSLKHSLYEMLTYSVNDAIEKVRNSTIESLIRNLKNIDYEKVLATLLSAEELNRIFTTNHFTDTRIREIINGFMMLVNKSANVTYEDIEEFVSKFVAPERVGLDVLKPTIDRIHELLKKVQAKNIDYDLLMKFLDPSSGYTNETFYRNIDKLIEYSDLYESLQRAVLRVLDKVPERLRDRSLLDYYEGNSYFHYDGRLPINLKGLFAFFPAQIEEKLCKVYDKLFANMPTEIHADFNATIPHVHKVTFNMWYKGEKSGFLPTKADVKFYGNEPVFHDSNIVYWVDIDGNPVLTMPDEDITVYPFLDQVVDLDKHIVKDIYHVKKTHTISVVHLKDSTYTYQWYRSGFGIFGFQPIEGATDDHYVVQEVPDNGMYYCVVTDTKTGLVYTTDFCRVTISRQLVMAPNPVDTSSFVYNGTPYVYPVLRNYRWDVINDTQTNAGSYAAKIVLVDKINYVWADTLDTRDKVHTWNISKQTVQIPPADDTYFIYDGTEKHYTIPENVLYTISGTEQTDPGVYEVIVDLIDKSNYQWSDGTSGAQTYEFNIHKRPIDCTNLIWSADSFIHDGNEHEVVITNLPEEVEVVYENNKGIDVGEYEAVATLSIKEEYAPTCEIIGDSIQIHNFSISTIDFKAIIDSGVAKTYDGKYSTMTVSTVGYGYNFTYQWYKNGVQIAGATDKTYSVKNVNENGKYCCEVTSHLVIDGVERKIVVVSDAVDVSIAKYEVERPTAGNDLTFNGTEQIYTINDSKDAELYTLTDNVATFAGEYTAKVRLNDTSNYCWEGGTTEVLNFKFHVNKAKVSKPSCNVDSFVYDGTLKTPEIKGNLDNINVSGDSSAISAGQYTLCLSLEDTDNYEWTDGTTDSLYFDWEIKKAKVTAPTVRDTVYTYDGTTKSPTVIGNSDKVTLSGDVAQTNANEYTLIITLADPNNYEWVNGGNDPLAFDWVINKAKVSKPIVTETLFDYDEQTHSIGLIYDETHSRVLGTTEAVESGTYSVTVILNDSLNYEWTDGTSSSMTFEWKIIAKRIAKPTKISQTSFVYDGTEKTVSVEDEDSMFIVEGNRGTDAGEYVLVVTLADSKNYAWEDGTIDPVSFVWKINKAKVSRPTSGEDLTYNGQTQTYTLIGDDTKFDVSGNTGKDAGTYYAYVELTDSKNYEWDNGTSGTLVYAWTINKAKIAKPTAHGSDLTYNGQTQTFVIDGEVDYYSISGNTGKDAGTYVAMVSIADSKNYEWEDGSSQAITIIWKINKATITIKDGDVVWDETSHFKYDGKEHSYSATISVQGVHLEYDENVATDPGQYTAVATVVLDDENNYELAGKTIYSHDWSIDAAQPGLSGGAVAGIVIGSVVALAIIGYVVFLLFFQKKDEEETEEDTTK